MLEISEKLNSAGFVLTSHWNYGTPWIQLITPLANIIKKRRMKKYQGSPRYRSQHSHLDRPHNEFLFRWALSLPAILIFKIFIWLQHKFMNSKYGVALFIIAEKAEDAGESLYKFDRPVLDDF